MSAVQFWLAAGCGCLCFVSATVGGEKRAVLPLVAPAETSSAEPKDFRQVQGEIYQSILKQARYMTSLAHPWSQDPSLLLITESGHDEHEVRPNAKLVEGLAFLYRFGPYDAATVGMERKELLANIILPMMRYLCAIHLTGVRTADTGKKWGDDWQSAYWADALGRGAWWIWTDLPEDLQDGIRRVIEHEADRIAGQEPEYQVSLNTRAEENAWNSRIFSSAMLLMPGHERNSLWENQFQRWTLSSFLRVSDATSQTIVDGKPVSEQYGGANIHGDFTLENHQRVHPGYMATVGLSAGCVLDYRMSGRTPPESMFYNVREIYENLKWLVHPDGGMVFPMGQDWELLARIPGGIGLHILMACQASDPDAWEMLHPVLDTMKRMQGRSETGAMALPGEHFFPSYLADMISNYGLAWLNMEYHGPMRQAPKARRGVRIFPEGQFILNRTESAIHAVSWGPQLMAQFNPMTQDRLIDPVELGGIGAIQQAGRTRSEVVSLKRLAVRYDADSFEIDWQLDHGREIRAFQTLTSKPDGTWRIKEKLVALSDVQTEEIRTGLMGILNNPRWIYEDGKRAIQMEEQMQEMIAAEGKEASAADCRKLVIDGILRIQANQPLSVLYRGAKEPRRGRWTDELYLNHIAGLRTWKKEQVISEYEVEIRCEGKK